MAQPTRSDVRPVDPVLTNLSFGFKNEKFFWEVVAPPVEVGEQSGTYFSFDRDYWLRRQLGADRAAGTPYLRVGYGVSTATYKALERGFERPLDDKIRAASQTPEDLQVVDTEFLTQLIQLELEKDVAAAVFATGKWGTDKTLSGTNQWSDPAISDPVTDVQLARNTVKQNTGFNGGLSGAGDRVLRMVDRHAGPEGIDLGIRRRVGLRVVRWGLQ